MVELMEIPLELQLKEANCRIKMHLSKGHKFQQFLSPMFLRRFPAIMENHISVDWNTISGVYDRTPTLPITLIDTEILDDWFACPQVWDVSCDLQHARRVLALVHYTLPTPYKGQPAIVFWASFVFVPAYQAHMNLRDSLTFLKSTKEDSVVLVVMPSKPTYSPQPQRSRYLTLLPISGSPDVDRGPLHTFTAAGLPVASKEGRSGDMSVRVKMPSCFGSSKHPKRELMWEPALQRGPLLKNVHYVECNSNGELVKGATGVDTVKGVCNGFLPYTRFLGFLEFSGYHQWQQESQ